MQLLRPLFFGLDNVSLLGSFFSSNQDFLFVSSVGYNQFNGMVIVYNNHQPLITQHSILLSPDNTHSVFGSSTAVTSAKAKTQQLAISAVGYDGYTGIVYLYTLMRNRWIKTHTLFSSSRVVYPPQQPPTNNNHHLLLQSTILSLYIKTESNNTWTLVETYALEEPEENPAYTHYKVHWLDDARFIIGHDGYDGLRGALYLGTVPKADGDPSNIQLIDHTRERDSSPLLFLFFLSVFFFGTIVLAVILTKLLCLPKQPVQPFNKKKKMVEKEAESPYKVYSYIGYNDYDDQWQLSPMERGISNPIVIKKEYDDKYDYYKSLEQVVSYRGYLYDTIQQHYHETIKPVLEELKQKKEK